MDYYFLFWDKVWATKPKTLGKEPKGIGNDDLRFVSQIFLPKTMGNDTMPCGFVYLIAPFMNEKKFIKDQERGHRAMLPNLKLEILVKQNILFTKVCDSQRTKVDNT